MKYPIRDYPDYAIDNELNVWSKRIYRGNPRGEWRKLKSSLNTSGYPFVSLINQFGRKSKGLHRIIAEAFIPNPENKPCINHINSIRTDYRIENLEWVTAKENVQHAYDTGRHTMKVMRAAAIASTSKPTRQMDLQGNTIADFVSQHEAERVTGIDQRSVSKACSGKLKTAGGYRWTFITKEKEPHNRYQVDAIQQGDN